MGNRETEHGDIVYLPPELSLRDYFAGCALTGILADPNVDAPWVACAEDVYNVADAMLERREL